MNKKFFSITIIFRRLFVIISFLFITSCQNHYKTFYKQFAIYDWQKIEFYVGKPTTINSTDMIADVAKYRRKGYGVIGFSDFNSGKFGNPEAKMSAVAQEIGAEVVIWNRVYTSTTNPNIYIMGFATVSHNSAVNRYNYGSVFLSKLKDIGVGIFTRDLTVNERAQKHLNYGAYIGVIMDDGPAFKSELAEGDVIVEVNGQMIKESRDFDSIDLKKVNSLKIQYVRDGKKKRVTLTLKEANPSSLQ